MGIQIDKFVEKAAIDTYGFDLMLVSNMVATDEIEKKLSPLIDRSRVIGEEAAGLLFRKSLATMKRLYVERRRRNVPARSRRNVPARRKP